MILIVVIIEHLCPMYIKSFKPVGTLIQELEYPKEGQAKR